MNCVRDGQLHYFKCDPVFEISSDGSGGILDVHEVTVDRNEFAAVGEMMCAKS